MIIDTYVNIGREIGRDGTYSPRERKERKTHRNQTEVGIAALGRRDICIIH